MLVISFARVLWLSGVYHLFLGDAVELCWPMGHTKPLPCKGRELLQDRFASRGASRID
jgi:hypothetical protein